MIENDILVGHGPAPTLHLVLEADAAIRLIHADNAVILILLASKNVGIENSTTEGVKGLVRRTMR